MSLHPIPPLGVLVNSVVNIVTTLFKEFTDYSAVGLLCLARPGVPDIMLK